MRPAIPTSARGLHLTFGLDPCARRRLHAKPWVSKSVKEKVAEVADKVNKKVGKGLASAIETGEQATEETLGATTQHAKDSAERAYQTGHKARQSGGDAASGAEEGGKKRKGL